MSDTVYVDSEERPLARLVAEADWVDLDTGKRWVEMSIVDGYREMAAVREWRNGG